MKVLLISANTLTAPYPVYPLGLDYVAHALSSRHEVMVADMNVMELKDLETMISRFTPDIIGLSLRNVDNTDHTDPEAYASDYRELADVIRSCTDAPLVLGGSGFTIFPSAMLRFLQADYGIIGEGERLGLLLDALEDHESLENIPGVITPETGEQIPRPWEGQFHRHFEGRTARVEYYLKKGGMLNLQTKRGCNFRCIYCTYPHIEGRKLRLISPEKVADTARMLEDQGARYLFITDSAFNAHESHSMDVARAFIKAGVTVPWGAFFAPVSPADEYYKLMADAGLTHVEFGTESLSDPVLKAYRKPFKTRDVFSAHKNALSAGLHTAHYILPGGPGETKDTLKETLSNIDKLAQTVLFFFCGMRIYPHTELYKIAVRENRIRPDQNLLEPIFYESESIGPDEIMQKIKDHAQGKMNWIIGAGGEDTARIISKMYDRGHTGPLWEHLIR